MTTVMKDRQEGQPEHVCLCTKGNTVYLGGDIRARQLECSIGGSQGQLRAINIQLCRKAQLT